MPSTIAYFFLHSQEERPNHSPTEVTNNIIMLFSLAPYIWFRFSIPLTAVAWAASVVYETFFIGKPRK